MNEHVKTIMTKNPVTLTPENTLGDVQRIFEKDRVHHLPIVDGRKLVGLITTYDLWIKNTPFDKYEEVKVKDVMCTKIAKIDVCDKVGTAAELFLDRRFHALPVMENEKLVGIVTSFDILKYEFKKEYKNIILYKDVLEQPRATA